MTPHTSRLLRAVLAVVLVASTLAACAAKPPARADGGTVKFVAATLTAKGIRP